MLVQDLRNSAIAELDDDNEPALGLVLLLDGLDEASSRLVSRVLLLQLHQQSRSWCDDRMILYCRVSDVMDLGL